MTFLSAVKDVFEIEGRGCVLVPGLDQSTSPKIRLRERDPISLHRPDGSVLDTRICALEFLDGPNRRWCVPILLPPNIKKADVPIGTEIWLLAESGESARG
jgi:hypothetical protein